MDALAAAQGSAAAVGGTASRFMLDGPTYERGAELGFQGIDFYVVGRGGVLGDVHGDVVAAAFAFFEPGAIRALWDQGRTVMPAADAAREFSGCCSAWADKHVPDDIDAARLAELAGRVAQGARSACAPVFAGWRAMPVPAAPKAAALHNLNVLRELRNGLHAAAVLAEGLAPLEALSIRTPHMVAMFGWAEAAPVDGLAPRWEQAEANTNRAIAHAYESLDEVERAELVELANAVLEATG